MTKLRCSICLDTVIKQTDVFDRLEGYTCPNCNKHTFVERKGVMKNVYKPLTDEQKNRGVVFVATPSNDQTDIGYYKVPHEVLFNEKDKEKRMRELEFHQALEGENTQYLIIRR